MADKYPTLLHRWFEEVWNKKNAAVIREMLTEDTLLHGVMEPGGATIQGYVAYEEFHKALLKAFPDLHIDVDEVVVQDNKIAGHFTVTGTHKDDFPGKPKTDKKVKFSGAGICKVEKDKFVEVWNVIDFSKLDYDLDPNTPDVQ